MTGPAMLDADTTKNYAFTPSSTVTLGRSTTYWVVAEGDTGWTYTATSNEDANPAMGWSIADNYEFRTASLTGSFTATNTGDVFQIRVNGTLGGIVNSSDATLSALALEDASDDSAITISPVFASGTTSYTASVDNGVDEITIKPTVNESSATVEYLDSSDTAITDANSVKTGQQVSLLVGATTIKVKVTAQDTTTTNPYTVVVTRAAAVPGSANVLVSNAGQSSTTANNSGRPRAQAFTTGAAGATLSSVEINYADAESHEMAVSLCTTDSSGYPTSSCTALTAPVSFASGTLVFTDPASTTLAANTTYTLLITSPESPIQNINLNTTSSSAQDTGAAAGWTIADAYNFKNLSNAWRTTTSGTLFLIAIKGTLAAANTPPTADDNTVTTGEDRPYTFTADDFEFDDADAGATLASVTIVTPPALGALALGSTAVMADDVVTKAQIDGDMLTFTPACARRRLYNLHLQGERRHGRQRQRLHDDHRRDGRPAPRLRGARYRRRRPAPDLDRHSGGGRVHILGRNFLWIHRWIPHTTNARG